MGVVERIPHQSVIQLAFAHECEIAQLIEGAYENAYANQRERERILWEKRNTKDRPL